MARTFSRKLGWAGVAAGAVALIAGGVTGLAAGNPNYLGILSGTDPTGYQVSPNAYDISSGPVTVTLNTTASNLTTVTQSVPLELAVFHILTLNGVDISNGQPGQTGITWTPGLWMQSTQMLTGKTTPITIAVPPMGAPPTPLSFSWTFSTCGYFQLDIGIPPHALAVGYVRVLGCSFASTFTPGYWKNHAAATTALLPQSLGSFPVSTFGEAQAIFDAMKCNQPANCLAGHLLAAELDVANGSDPCIQPTIDDANSLLTSIGYAGVGTYALTSAQATQALNDEATLDAYTNDTSVNNC